MLHQQKVSPAILASTNVGSPDPRTPPNGQMIVAEWWIPKRILEYDPMLKIHILFHDFSETCVEYPICRRFGYKTYSILNDDFKKTGGFLAYHAEILTCDGEVYADWKHQLWVKLIKVEEDDIELMSSAEVEKSMQGSVIETPLWSSFN